MAASQRGWPSLPILDVQRVHDPGGGCATLVRPMAVVRGSGWASRLKQIDADNEWQTYSYIWPSVALYGLCIHVLWYIIVVYIWMRFRK